MVSAEGVSRFGPQAPSYLTNIEGVNDDSTGTWRRRAEDFKSKSQKAACVAVGATLAAVQLEASGVRYGAIASLCVSVAGAMVAGVEVALSNFSTGAAEMIESDFNDLISSAHSPKESANLTGTS